MRRITVYCNIICEDSTSEQRKSSLFICIILHEDNHLKIVIIFLELIKISEL